VVWRQTPHRLGSSGARSRGKRSAGVAALCRGPKDPPRCGGSQRSAERGARRRTRGERAASAPQSAGTRAAPGPGAAGLVHEWGVGPPEATEGARSAALDRHRIEPRLAGRAAGTGRGQGRRSTRGSRGRSRGRRLLGTLPRRGPAPQRRSDLAKARHRPRTAILSRIRTGESMHRTENAAFWTGEPRGFPAQAPPRPGARFRQAIPTGRPGARPRGIRRAGPPRAVGERHPMGAPMRPAKNRGSAAAATRSSP
jgi:hypothetical protein